MAQKRNPHDFLSCNENGSSFLSGETQGNFDTVLVNDNLDKTYKKLKEFVLSELERTAEKNGKVISGFISFQDYEHS